MNAKLFGHILTGFSLRGSFYLEGNTFMMTLDYLGRYLEQLLVNTDNEAQVRQGLIELNKAFQAMIVLEKDITKLNTLGNLNGTPEAIAKDVLNLEEEARLFMPGGDGDLRDAHAMVYEFKRDEDALLFSVYNSGDGLEYHEQKSSKKQNLSCPVHTYRVLHFYSATTAEQHTANEIALARFISPLIVASVPALRVADSSLDSNSKRMYQEVFPAIIHLGGKPIAVGDSVPTHAWTIAQLSGTCTQEVLYRILAVYFKSSSDYQRFIYQFKRYALEEYLSDLNDPHKNLEPGMTDPGVLNQLSVAIEELLRTLNQPDVFTFDEQKQDLETFKQIKQRLPVSQVFSTPQMSIASFQRDPNYHVVVRQTKDINPSPYVTQHTPMKHLIPIQYLLNPKYKGDLLTKLDRICSRCEKLFIGNQYQAIIEQIELVFNELPLPANLDNVVDYYRGIDTLAKARHFSQKIARLQELHMSAHTNLYGHDAIEPRMMVTQLSALCILDCVNKQCPLTGDSSETVSMMTHDICRIIRFHKSDPYLVTNSPLLDKRFQSIKTLYFEHQPQEKISDAYYLTYYKRILNTQPALIELLEAAYKKEIHLANTEQHDELRRQKLEALYYFTSHFEILEGMPLYKPLIDSFSYQLELEHCFVNVLRIFQDKSCFGNYVSTLTIGFKDELSHEVVIKGPSHNNVYARANERLLRHKYNLTPRSICERALAFDHYTRHCIFIQKKTRCYLSAL